MQTSKNTSSTSDSAREELNGSESRTIGNVNDFNAKVNMRGKYYLDNNLKHHISFGGNLGYDGTRGNSEENSVTRYLTSTEGCRFEFNGYSGFSSGYNRPDWLLNLRLAKSIGSFTISLTAHDILGTSKSFSHMASAEYVEDTYRNNLGRCILVGLSYNFGTWNFRKQSRMEMLERRSNL